MLADGAIDHVGIVVRDTPEALRLYVGLLGLHPGPTETSLEDNVKITFLDGENARVEMIEPLPGDSAVARFLEKRGEGLHHLCLVVPNLARTLESLRGAGYQLVDAPPRRNAQGRLLAFVHPKAANGVLIELYQADPVARWGAVGETSNGSTSPRECSEAIASPGGGGD
jgi:methylmalonyl-CoA epimerase